MPDLYLPYHDQHKAELMEMIHALYRDDPEGEEMSEDKIERTVAFLASHPENGQITLLSRSENIIGYAILIRYWSNEYGGLLLFLDELFVKEDFRGQGIGTHFIQDLLDSVGEDFKAVFLEVIPSNDRALQLYQRLGFQPAKNKYLRYVL